MNVKNFVAAGLVGGAVDFLLGFLLWGLLASSLMCCPSVGEENMMFISLGCLTFGLTISYIFVRWAGITDAMSGLKAGAVLGLFIGLLVVFFSPIVAEPCMKNIAINVIFYIICGAGTGAVVALVNGKMK